MNAERSDAEQCEAKPCAVEASWVLRQLECRVQVSDCILKTKNECVNVEGTMSCNAREEIGHLDLVEAGAFGRRLGRLVARRIHGRTGQWRPLDEYRET